MLTWCSENIQGIIFVKIDSDCLKQHVKKYKLDVCYVKESVRGSKIHHSLILKMSEFEVRIISADMMHSSKVPVSTRNTKNLSDFDHGMYVVCIDKLALQWNLMKDMSNLWKE